MKNIIGIIPARYASQRLNAKPLADIGGLPMIIRVWENVSASKYLERVIVATDDNRIVNVCKQFNCPYIMTNHELNSGTERVFAAYKILNNNENIIVNIQGDEPLLMAKDIDILLEQFLKTDFDVGTLITKVKNNAEIFNPSNVKVVLDKNNCAMYFSRSPIPFIRDLPQENWHNKNFWKHIGVYAYNKNALEAFASLQQCNLENYEKLEQLRLLELGYKFYCVETDTKLVSIDTQEDLNLVREMIKKYQCSKAGCYTDTN
jgi:3-deoxy-manno-octulosonate cytidylyltransferase (CMP-KDO synthetase)